MRFFRLYSFFVVSVLALILSACSDDDDGTDYPFDREVMDMSVMLTCGPKAAEGDSCYRVRFQYPLSTDKLEGIYLWLGTDVVDDTSKSVSSSDLDKSDTVLKYSSKKGKSFDTVDVSSKVKKLLKKSTYDTLQVAIFCKYSKGDAGLVQRAFFILRDGQAPSLVSIRDSVWTSGGWIEWTRPTDQRNFHTPSEISGPIAGYNVVISSDDKGEDLRKLKLTLEGSFSDTVRHARIRMLHDSLVVDSTSRSSKEKNVLRMALLDGKGFDLENDSANLFRLTIVGLRSESRYSIGITSLDSAGNSSKEVTHLLSTTDSIAPIMPNAVVTIEDTLFPGTGLARLDSNNRLVVFWSRSVDPLVMEHGIVADTALIFPKGCVESTCYDSVASYEILRYIPLKDTWEPMRFSGGPSSNYVRDFDWEDGEMAVVDGGRYVSDTIRWVSPGDTVILRIRSRDVSGYYSRALVDTIYVSPGALSQELECPEGFVAISISDTNKFCMERFEHMNDSGEFVRNVFHAEAQAACEAISASGFKVSLCKERDWELACLSGGTLTYGVVQDDTIPMSSFLFENCGVGSEDSTSAVDLAKRNYRCVNSWGVHDLSGNMQEWVNGRSEDTIAVLKGGSYKTMNGLDIETQAQCTNRGFPVFTRLAYTKDSVFLYREGTRVDTVYEPDTSRTLFKVLTKKDFKDSLQFFDVQDSSGNSLGVDYAPYSEYKNGGEEWLKSVSNGLVYVPDHIERVFLTGEKVPYRMASSFYKSSSIGFRCCAYPE